MICCIPFCYKDVASAKSLLEWCKLLGPQKNHDALLISDAAVQWSDVTECLEIAREIFNNVEVVPTDKPLNGWPQAANAMFSLAAYHVASHHRQPFFWMEPDCVPLKPGWLDALEAEYKKLNKPFMGAFVRSQEPSLPPMSLAGCAVYPADTQQRIGHLLPCKRAWDVDTANVVMPQAVNTFLVQHFYGQKDLPPVFSKTKTSHSTINTFTLDNLRSEAVVFHRNKDGSLILLLRKKLFPGLSLPEHFLIVLPICNRDADLMARNLRWMIELGGCPEHDCLIPTDSDTLSKHKQAVQQAAKECFHSVSTMEYRCGSVRAWPQGANVAFRTTCHHIMQKDHERPWLWLEADAIPLHSGWQDRLQMEYDQCGRAFFGPIVPSMGHMNGVGIYPFNTAEVIPRAIHPSLPTHIAWDSAMRQEMIQYCFDASQIIQHVWGIVNGNPHPTTGESPVFDAPWKYTAWVNKKASLFHRNKDGSLINCIRDFNKHHR